MEVLVPYDGLLGDQYKNKLKYRANFFISSKCLSCINTTIAYGTLDDFTCHKLRHIKQSFTNDSRQERINKFGHNSLDLYKLLLKYYSHKGDLISLIASSIDIEEDVIILIKEVSDKNVLCSIFQNIRIWLTPDKITSFNDFTRTCQIETIIYNNQSIIGEKCDINGNLYNLRESSKNVLLAKIEESLKDLSTNILYIYYNSMLNVETTMLELIHDMLKNEFNMNNGAKLLNSTINFYENRLCLKTNNLY